jgi:hypothetical protein
MIVCKKNTKKKKKKCLNLEGFLKCDIYYDIDGLDLFSKLNVLT